MYTAVIPYAQPSIKATTVAPSASAVSTTLYDLIKVVQDLVAPHEDELVVNVVAYLLHSGYMTLEPEAPAYEVSAN